MQQEYTPDKLAWIAEHIEAEAYRDLFSFIDYTKVVPFQANAQPDVEDEIRLTDEFGAVALVAETERYRSTDTHRVLCLGIDEPTTEEVLGEVLRLYGPYGAPFRIQLTPYSLPSNLGQWVLDSRKGVKASPGADKFLWDPQAIPSEDDRRDFGVVEINYGLGEEYGYTVAKALGLETNKHWITYYGATVGSRYISRQGWYHYFAMDGDRVLGGASMFVKRYVAYLFGSATLPEYRGRGVEQALIERRVEDARDDIGADFIVADTNGGTSREELERAGFRYVYSRTDFEVPPAG